MINVVIVEDEMLVRLGMKMCVDDYCSSMKVSEVFSNAEEALEYLEENYADILITDIRLTGMTGLELIEKIKPKYPDMLILVLSCYEDFSYARKAYDLGADKYLLKHELVENDLPKTVLELYDKHYKEKNFSAAGAAGVIKQQTVQDGMYQIGYIALRHRNGDCYVNGEDISYSMAEEIIQEILNLNHMGECYLRHETMLFCIFSFERKSSDRFRMERLQSFYRGVQKNIKNVFNKEVYMSISDTFLELNEVQVNFENAKKRMSYAFYYPLGTFLYSDIVKDENLPESFPDIREILAENNEDGFREFLITYIEKSKQSGLSAEEVKVQVVRFIHELDSFLRSNYAIELDSLFEAGKEPNYIKVESICFADSLVEWVIQIIESVKNKIKRQGMKETAIAKIKDYIAAVYDKPVTLSEAAEVFHMNTVYFCQFFKKETGVTFVHYLNQYRIEQAKKLLKTTDDTVEVIAQKVGIENPNYFFRLFKKITGVTVGDFKKQN